MNQDSFYPTWFESEFIRIFRKPISRIIKKANKQIRETKKHFNINTQTGVLVFVNDGFTSIFPILIQAIVADLLLYSYSSIDCLIYLNINKYIEIPGSEEPKILWSPMYSDRAEDTLPGFVDTLGREWFDFLSDKMGGFTSRTESQERNLIRDARYIEIPN